MVPDISNTAQKDFLGLHVTIFLEFPRWGRQSLPFTLGIVAGARLQPWGEPSAAIPVAPARCTGPPIGGPPKHSLKATRDSKRISDFCYLKSYSGAEILISTGPPDPLEKVGP